MIRTICKITRSYNHVIKTDRIYHFKKLRHYVLVYTCKKKEKQLNKNEIFCHFATLQNIIEYFFKIVVESWGCNLFVSTVFK